MAYIQANGGKGLPIEEIFQGFYDSGRKAKIINKNGNQVVNSGDDYTLLCDASICIGTISGSYFLKVTVKKAGYYSYMTSYPNGYGTIAPTGIGTGYPKHLNVGDTLYNNTANTSQCVIIYYGETNPFA